MRNMQNILGKDMLESVSFMTYYNSDRAVAKFNIRKKEGGKRSRWIELTKKDIEGVTSKTLEERIVNHKRHDYNGALIGEKVNFPHVHMKDNVKGIVKSVGFDESIIGTVYGDFVIPNKEIELENI